MHNLRRILPDPDQFIEVDSKTLMWRSQAPFILDVAEFEQAVSAAEVAEQIGDFKTVRVALERAVTLYQGDLLPGCDDEWILPEQERLKQTYIGVLEWLIERLKQQQDDRGAMRYAQQLLEVAPLNEATYYQLMQLHALGGDRASALQVYHRCMTILREELGVDPSPATRNFYDRFLRDDDEQGSKGAGDSRSRGAEDFRSREAEGNNSALPLVGREQEWTIICNWLASASGKAKEEILLLLGESGIGKTRLVQELAAKVQAEGGCVLWGRGFESEMLRPYGAWIDALRSVSNLPPELSSLFPEVQDRKEIPVDRSQLFDAVVRLLSQLSQNGEPTAIILDDIQWLDEASTALLHYAIRLLGNSSVLFACTARERELTDNISACKLVQALRREQLELGDLLTNRRGAEDAEGRDKKRLLILEGREYGSRFGGKDF